MERDYRDYEITAYLNSTTKIVVSTAVLYFFLAKFVRILFIHSDFLIPLSPSVGFASAFVIIFKRKAILGVLIGSFLFSLSLYMQELVNPVSVQSFLKNFLTCFIRPSITVLNAFLVSYLVHFWCRTSYPFNSSRGVIYFVLSGLLASFIASAFGFGFIAITQLQPFPDIRFSWNYLFRNNSLGVVLFTPFVLSWLYKKHDELRWTYQKKLEFLIILIVTIVAGIYVFYSEDSNESILYLILIWAAYRFELKIVTVLGIIIAIISIYYTGLQMGSFTFREGDYNFVMLQLFLAIDMATILFFKAVLKEKENEQEKLKISEKDLSRERNVLKEIIESSYKTSIFALDDKLNYLVFNHTHEKFMKDHYGASIKIGDNIISHVPNEDKREKYSEIFQSVLEGNVFDKEANEPEEIYWKLSESPIRDNYGNIVGLSAIFTDITELKLKEKQLEKNNYDLYKRNRELSCLFNITKIVSLKSSSISEKLLACARTIPNSLHFSEKSNCRIQFLDEEFFSSNYQKNDVQFSQQIIINGIELGSIEVGYHNTETTLLSDVFLDEEIKLLETFSDIISKSLQTIVAEKSLKESEEKLRTIYESFEDVYFRISIEGIVLEVSPSAEKHLKMKRESIIGLNAYDFHADREKGKHLYEKVLENGFVQDYEERLILADGEIVYFSFNAKVVHDIEGRPAYFEGTMREINERVLSRKELLKASKKIRKSEEKFRSIYENMQDVYYLHTLEGTILDISPSIEKHFQEKRENFIGQNAQSLYKNPEKYIVDRAKILSEGCLNDYEIELLTSTGDSLFFSVNSKLIKDSKGNFNLVEGAIRNINDRILSRNILNVANEEIKKSEKEHRAIFESFDDLYYRVSMDGTIENISPSSKKMLKYDRDELIGTSSFKFYWDQDDRDKGMQLMREKGKISDHEIVFRDKYNNAVYVSINAHFLYDSNGVPIYIEGVTRDITQRKKIEKEIEIANQVIKESEKKYRNIFESVSDVFFLVSAKDNKIVEVSPSCSYFEVKREELLGKSFQDLYFNIKEREEVLNMLNNNGEIRNYDARFLFKEKVFHVSLNCKIHYDVNGLPEFLIGSIRDISDRVKAEENLRISEAKFRSIYENFEDIYYKTTLEGIVLDISPSFEKYFKIERDKVVGSMASDFYYDNNDRNLLLEKLKKYGYISDSDAQCLDAHGNIIYFSVNARIVYDEFENPLYIEGTMRDITDRIFSKEEMLAKSQRLEFQNAELEQFAYIASHDLQEPLITINHCIELLRDEAPESLDEDQKQYLDFISSSTSRMQLLVKGLLDYSRIGKDLKLVDVNCNETVANVLEDMHISLKESNAIVEYENLPVIKSNEIEVRQLFQNLISNACKYRKRDHQLKIKITVVKQYSSWLFSIEDNGIGIQEDDIDKVFVIFKRLHNRDEYQGIGIGLSHCKKIIEHHGGKIWVESEYNIGSTFKWTIPIEGN